MVDFSHPPQPSVQIATRGLPATETAKTEEDRAVGPEPDESEKDKPESPDAALKKYDFDEYDGKLYRVFEGSVFEGVVTNHIDGGLSGPILLMLATDYYPPIISNCSCRKERA